MYAESTYEGRYLPVQVEHLEGAGEGHRRGSDSWPLVCMRAVLVLTMAVLKHRSLKISQHSDLSFRGMT